MLICNRKIVYSGLLSTTATALCFPNQAKEVNDYARQQANIFYRTYIWPRALPKPKSKEATPVKSESKSNEKIIQGKDQIIKIEKQAALKTTDEITKGDTGMANSDDQDMYTTRGK